MCNVNLRRVLIALALMVETLAALGLKQLARSRGRRDLPAAP